MRYEGQSYYAENIKIRNSSLSVRSVKRVSAFPFLNERVAPAKQDKTDKHTLLAYIDRKIGSRLGLIRINQSTDI
jgi:hypothetical protein